MPVSFPFHFGPPVNRHTTKVTVINNKKSREKGSCCFIDCFRFVTGRAVGPNNQLFFGGLVLYSYWQKRRMSSLWSLMSFLRLLFITDALRFSIYLVRLSHEWPAIDNKQAKSFDRRKGRDTIIEEKNPLSFPLY